MLCKIKKNGKVIIVTNWLVLLLSTFFKQNGVPLGGG